MLIAFRADASLDIGTGHIMRCLTLAEALAARGADCRFICREHEGNLNQLIGDRGFAVYALPVLLEGADQSSDGADSGSRGHKNAHSHWLGATQEQDANACAAILADVCPDWLIVDHYALDETWQLTLKSYCRRLMVIDDLADRPHACDLLLDQNLGRRPEDYRGWVPQSCQVFCGVRYALLRPEFEIWRSCSIQRRAEPVFRNLLIAMGGVDKDNVTGMVLDSLVTLSLPADCKITVVMGATAPRLQDVEQQASLMPWPTRVLVGVDNMAELMANSDLAIGAAGATSWERCCMGLPTIMVVLADNQRLVAQSLAAVGAAKVIAHVENVAQQLPLLLTPLIESSQALQRMGQSAMSLVDGRGVDTVIRTLES